jgi:3-methylfumaryl-CoA hydratase
VEVVERTELIVPSPAEALGSLLDVPTPDLYAGEPLPLLWHWLYLLERPATTDLGPDGHPVRGTVPTPPGPGRRRMWAGGRVTHLGGLRIGAPATRRTDIVRSVDKQGRSGPITIVTVRHQLSQHGKPAIEEEQDILYRDAAGSLPTPHSDLAAAGQRSVGGSAAASLASASSASASSASGDWTVATPATLLFRFSALTYNAHRIHYDRDYARGVEGYPGLVVHGPLQALLMSEAVRRQRPVPRHGTLFSYRLVAPVFDHEGLVVSVHRSDAPSIAAVGEPGAEGSSAPKLLTTVRSRNGHITATGTYQNT